MANGTDDGHDSGASQWSGEVLDEVEVELSIRMRNVKHSPYSAKTENGGVWYAANTGLEAVRRALANDERFSMPEEPQ